MDVTSGLFFSFIQLQKQLKQIAVNPLYIKTWIATKRVADIPHPFFYALSEKRLIYAENQSMPE